MDLPGYPFLTARWRNLVMLNYEVDPMLLIDRVPAGTTLDFWQGKSYASLIGFQFHDVKVLGAPVPFHQDFEEVNLRFYVRRVVGDEVRSGVVFVCEVVPRHIVGGMARLLYREPYLVVPMTSEVRVQPPDGPVVHYAWEIGKQWHSVRARAEGQGAPPEPRTLEEFIAVRHWGYNGRPGSDTLEYRVEHRRWSVWRAGDVQLEGDLVALCGVELAGQLASPATAYIADGSAVTVYWRTRIT